MSWKRAILRRLDRPATRSLLAWLTTAKARTLLRQDVRIWYDTGLWLHRVGAYAIPDGPQFRYYEETILAWADEIPGYFRNASNYWFAHYQPKSGDTVIDVGAGRGEDSLPFSLAVGPTGRVLAIECDPNSYQLLERFCTVNQLRNIKPIHAALMDRTGVVALTDSPEWIQTSVSWPGAAGSAEVRANTLDQICSEEDIGRIDFLKMNIEGAEASALLGMRETIKRIRNICVCCHDFRAERGHGEHYRTREFVQDFLATAGFSLSFNRSAPYDFLRDHVYGQRV